MSAGIVLVKSGNDWTYCFYIQDYNLLLPIVIILFKTWIQVVSATSNDSFQCT